MNKAQRKELSEHISKLEEIKSALETMQEYETEKLVNMPEGLQETKRGEKMQEGIDQLEYANDNLQDAIDNLQEIIDNA